MKVRNDYVSNSSSSSFIVKGDKASEALETFNGDFGAIINESSWPNPLGESMEVMIKTKDDENPWDYSWTINDFISGVKDGKVKYSDATEVMFECDDWDRVGMMYLAFIFRYFKALGYEPDDSNTEPDFKLDSDNGCFLDRLLSKIEQAESKNLKAFSFE